MIKDNTVISFPFIQHSNRQNIDITKALEKLTNAIESRNENVLAHKTNISTTHIVHHYHAYVVGSEASSDVYYTKSLEQLFPSIDAEPNEEELIEITLSNLNHMNEEVLNLKTYVSEVLARIEEKEKSKKWAFKKF